MCRLDRLLIFLGWAELFPVCIQREVPRPMYDHCPISLFTDLEDWGTLSFRLTIAWLSEKSFLKGVPVWWSEMSSKGWMGVVPNAQGVKEENQ